MVTNKRSIHIEWGHCDPAGIVYFPRYFEYFDACTNVLFESVGLPKPKLLEKFAIVGIPVVETRARFLLPAFALNQRGRRKCERQAAPTAVDPFPTRRGCRPKPRRYEC